MKGFAQQEKDVLLGVTEARAKVGSIQATPELVNDPAAFQKFQAAQGELSGAVAAAGRRRGVSATEIGPELPRPPGAARRHRKPHHRRAQPLHQGGSGIQHDGPQFPNNLTAMIFGYKPKPQFTVENENAISTAPTVDFDPRAPAPSSSARRPPCATVRRIPARGAVPLAFPAAADVAVPPLKAASPISPAPCPQRTRARAAAAAIRGAQGQPGRRPDRADDGAGDHRAVRPPRRRAWKIGRKRVDDGALLVVAKNDRKLRIEVGYGLEGVLPDGLATHHRRSHHAELQKGISMAASTPASRA